MMNTASDPAKGLIEIRKYSNRRYYDATRSGHITLEGIQDLVKEGYDIRVTDNQTSADITSKVLTQIILDLDAPKLDIFPAALLAQLIRVNDHLVKGFYERFFGQAIQSFVEYQRLMESQWKQAPMFPGMLPAMGAWTGAAAKPPNAPHETDEPTAEAAGVPPGEDMAARLAELQAELRDLKAQMKGSAKTRSRPPRSRPRR